jgi:hypothetical protein
VGRLEAAKLIAMDLVNDLHGFEIKTFKLRLGALK